MRIVTTDPRNPPEEQVQRTVAQWLDLHGVLWCHVPNEGRHKPQYRAKMAALGLKPGVPDILVFDVPPAWPEAKGTAIELKRGKGGRVSKAQQEWLEALGDRGWVCAVCEGIDEALELLQGLGYGEEGGGVKGEAMCVGSLFSGIGGLDLGLERAGMQVAWQVEIDEYCRKVLTKHWPDARIYEDVKTVGKQNLKAVDVVCGGFPCQDVSVAGRRAGLDGSRSGLWWEFHRVISEINPTWVIIENVPGLLSSNGGRDMGAILRALGDLGYGWAYRVLDAQYFGVAQRRRRVFIVGCLGDRTRAAEVLFEPESCGGDTAPSRAEGGATTRGFETGPGGNRLTDLAPTLDSRCKDGPIRNQVGCGVLHSDATSGTLRASASQWDHTGDESKLIAVAGFRGGDIGHSLRADPSKADKPSSSTYIITGWDSQRQRIHDAGGVSPTLQSEEGRGHGVPTVLYGVSTNQRGEARLRDVHGALTASRSGKQFDGVLRALPSKAKKRCAAQVEFVNQGSGGNRGWAGKEEPTFTLTTSGPSGVCGSTGVRRLTPTECERLQGFPDGWTLIDDHTADTPRYRALGNAVAVPVAQWIAERIVQHARRSQAQEKAAG